MGEIAAVLDKPDFDPDDLGELLGGILDKPVEIVIIDPGYMRVLNRKYRHIDRSTDVLSFDLALSEDSRPEGVIYVDGRLYPPMDALLERIFHGYLHLLGYTHDVESDANTMAEKVEAMVRSALD